MTREFSKLGTDASIKNVLPVVEEDEKKRRKRRKRENI